jgi:NTP pyrophosphatase (non-canonical NTP hydrolase)
VVLSKHEIQSVKDIIDLEYLTHSTTKLQDRLSILKKNEPQSDKPFFRLAIIFYEIGKVFASLEHAIVYAERFKHDPALYNQEIKNAQLELGDCFVQLSLLCKTYNLDIWETLELGINHLEERHKDFEIKGWTEV